MVKKTLKYRRLIPAPGKSFLLFGPRGTGKSTWVGDYIKPSVTIDLLQSDQFFKYTSSPQSIRSELDHCQAGDWVLIDEAQRAPELLNEVHYLIENKKIKFAITVSSARKLKRRDANLLGGRALHLSMFPLIWGEIQDESKLSTALDFGTLPYVLNEPQIAADTLASYVEVYLKEEIASEALTRNLEPFARFLRIAAQHHAQILNIESVAQSSAVKRRNVDNYFQILEDTFIGYRLPAIKFGFRSKEMTHPKFYFFDAGVSRAASGWIREPMDHVWRGFSLETLVLNELRAFNSYAKKDKGIFHYGVSGSLDVDFVVELEKKILQKPPSYLAIEVKLAKQWRSEWNKNLEELISYPKSRVRRAIGIYLGENSITQGSVEIMNFLEFSKKLWAGDFF